VNRYRIIYKLRDKRTGRETISSKYFELPTDISNDEWIAFENTLTTHEIQCDILNIYEFKGGKE
jgi:hypothetical protein